MATQKRRSTGRRSVKALKAGETTENATVALTLKVEKATFLRLCDLRVTQKRSKQEILKQAVMEYLERVGA
jgi:hypothetical protein